jgi:hypothetical protein
MKDTKLGADKATVQCKKKTATWMRKTAMMFT